uniref:CAP-Gly domain-containing linker protein 4-like n=1 Tax=Seriola dumerili TaxID=41447 RepID=A0A3B4U4R4_SERDU
MTAYILWTVITWTVKGILCTCRFLWICPYNAIKFLPREQHITEDTSRQLKQLVTAALHKRLTKTEREILSLKTRIVCERASWERRFAELQRKQEELRHQVRSWRTFYGPQRVFVPHSPMDLQIGHRVRIMLPSGRISTGTIRFLGHLQGEADLHLGVELQTPDHGLHDGSHRGRSYFEKPGYGAFVPFHKLLMAWE